MAGCKQGRHTKNVYLFIMHNILLQKIYTSAGCGPQGTVRSSCLAHLTIRRVFFIRHMLPCTWGITSHTISCGTTLENGTQRLCTLGTYAFTELNRKGTNSKRHCSHKI